MKKTDRIDKNKEEHQERKKLNQIRKQCLGREKCRLFPILTKTMPAMNGIKIVEIVTSHSLKMGMEMLSGFIEKSRLKYILESTNVGQILDSSITCLRILIIYDNTEAYLLNGWCPEMDHVQYSRT